MKDGVKKDPVRRWALPDRVFFGNGACHILAGVYLQAPPLGDFFAERIVPAEGFAGNHIYVTDGVIAFDYHGYSLRNRLLRYYTNNWSAEYDEGWQCRLEMIDFDLLDSRALNVRKMLGPEQYGYNVMARAAQFLDKIDHQAAYTKAVSRQAPPIGHPCQNPMGEKKPRCEGAVLSSVMWVAF